MPNGIESFIFYDYCGMTKQAKSKRIFWKVLCFNAIEIILCERRLTRPQLFSRFETINLLCLMIQGSNITLTYNLFDLCIP